MSGAQAGLCGGYPPRPSSLGCLDSHRPPSWVQALTILRGQLQGRGVGLSHGEESVGDVGQKAIEVQKLPPARLLLWAPQQHGHHAGEELFAPLSWWLPPLLHLGR